MDFQFEIKRIIEVYSNNQQPIVQFRFRRLNAMNDYCSVNGYPKPLTLGELSLLPAYFQEAIYDGIRWYDQNASLEHLEIPLELDCMFHNYGKARKELSLKEFKEYIDFSSDAINGIREEPKKSLLIEWLTKFGIRI